MTVTTPEYIIVPAGELLAPHWVVVTRLPDGHKITCIAMMMRDMAVVCNAGGSICHPSGKPLSTPELAAVLGVDTLWLEPVLHDVLAPNGIVSADDDGWSVTDPVFLKHLKRLNRKKQSEEAQEPPVLEIEGPVEGETQSEKSKRQGRNRKKKSDFRKKWGVEPVTVTVTKALQEPVTWTVTQSQQVTVNKRGILALPYNNSIGCNGSTPSTSDSGVGGGEIASTEIPSNFHCAGKTETDEPFRQNAHQLLVDSALPRADIPGLIPKVIECLAAGHDRKNVGATIELAIKQHKPGNGRTVGGLTFCMLSKLADTLPFDSRQEQLTVGQSDAIKWFEGLPEDQKTEIKILYPPGMVGCFNHSGWCKEVKMRWESELLNR